MKLILWSSFIAALLYVVTIILLLWISPRWLLNIIKNKTRLVVGITKIWWYGSISVFVVTLIIYHLMQL